jgi:hypothetical protein
MTNWERIKRLEESHIKLMTEREMEDRKNDRGWKRHRRFMRDHDARMAELDVQRAADDVRWAEHRKDQEALDKRISDLVSGIGAFIAAQKKPGAV